ncbi:MAG: HIT family protein [Candidatus Aenigmarchaeota archaeon]|nr:HIT family protein [Candidatus Aenigmarchaeota archaeon]
MKNCIFCNPKFSSKRIAENGYFFALFDNHPVSRGHALIISRRHIDSFFGLTKEEMPYLFDLLKKAKKEIDEKFHPDGYNVGINVGKAAGQTVFHLHVHIIPRYKGDVTDPTGGVRNVIPGKGNYLKKKT